MVWKAISTGLEKTSSLFLKAALLESEGLRKRTCDGEDAFLALGMEIF